MTETAIVTGAAGRVGEAIARRLAASGVHCILVDRDPAVRGIAIDVGGIAVLGDLSDPDLCTRAVAHTDGRLDLLVLTAETTSPGQDPDVLDLRGYRSVVGINQDGVVYGLRAALPVMRRRGGGSIVITASVAGLVGVESDPFYTMTKHAVIGLVRATAGRLARDGVRLSAVCAGPCDAPLLGDPFGDAWGASCPDPAMAPSPDPVAAIDAADVAAAVESALRTAEPGSELVLRQGRTAIPYAAAPLP